MKKLVILSLIAPAMLGLSACGGAAPANNSTDVVVTNDTNLVVEDNTVIANDSVQTENVSNAQ